MISRRLRWSLGTVVLYLVIVGGGLVVAHGDPAWFIHFGRGGGFVGVARHDFGPRVPIPLRDGADGQTFWALGRDPLLRHPKTIEQTFDRPVYRSQRIAYPALASPGRLFGPRGLAWSLIVVNLVGVGVGGYAAAALTERRRGPARAALAWGLNPAIATAVILDTSDVVAIAALLVCVWLVTDGRWRWAIVAGVVACLAKELMLLPLVAMALANVMPRMTLRRRVTLVAWPAAAILGWGLYERWRLGWAGTKLQELTWPVGGYIDAYRRGWRPQADWANAAVAIVLLVVAVTIVVAWARRRHDLLLTAALPFALLTPFLSAQVVGLSTNSSRALAPALTLAALAAMAPSAGDGREEGADPARPAPSTTLT
jgi:hypothetical protein